MLLLIFKCLILVSNRGPIFVQFLVFDAPSLANDFTVATDAQVGNDIVVVAVDAAVEDAF